MLDLEAREQRHVVVVTLDAIHRARHHVAHELLGLFEDVVGVDQDFPDLTTAVAHLFGIGRGADMVGYLTTAAFLAYLLFQYLKSQRERDKVIRLARQVALIDAANRYHLN